MKFRWQILPVFAAVLSICASASCDSDSMPSASSSYAQSYAQQKLRSGAFPVRSACMMPPQGHLTRISLKGAEAMTKESDAWAMALGNFVASRLGSDGVAITPAFATLDSGASQQEVRQVLFNIQQKFDAVSSLLDKKPKEIGKSIYTLNDQVAMLPCSARSDILVFVQGEGQAVTKARDTMSMLASGPAEGAILRITMADAETGEILAFIRINNNFGPFLNDPEATFGTLLDNKLSGMNIGSARKNIRAGTH